MANEAYWEKRDKKLTLRAKRIYKVLFGEPFPAKVELHLVLHGSHRPPLQADSASGWT